MSDIDDFLADLAGLDDKKRKKRQNSSGGSAHKRRRAESPAESVEEDDAPESEEDEPNPYPLEGKYKDEADRQRLLQMSEIEREDILAQRQEELQRNIDKRNLNALYKSRNVDDDSVAKAAKRQHTVRGQTKEKSKKLDELKARRKAKDEKKRRNSPKRESSVSSMEMGTDDDEDGQVTKHELEEERDRKRMGESSSKDESMTIEDLQRCRLSRQLLSNHCMAPWFADYVKGAWVRAVVGNDSQNQPLYRVCEILSLGPEKGSHIYQLEGNNVNQQLELRHGQQVKFFTMDIISNSPFTDKEFDRVKAVWKNDGVELPTKQQLLKKVEDMKALVSQPKTDVMISAMMARRALLRNGKLTHQELTLKRSQLAKERTLAQRRHEPLEVARLDKAIEELNKTITESAPPEEKKVDLLAQVNERNRRANFEAVRKAEQAEAERKRRDRKLASAGTIAPVDPSARVRTVPRVFNQASRSGTPGLGTPKLKPDDNKQRSISPLPGATVSPSQNRPKDAISMLKSIEVDLGDF